MNHTARLVLVFPEMALSGAVIEAKAGMCYL